MTATVTGVAIRPTVSSNRRRYTVENLKKAHARLATRLADPRGRPVTMRLFHPQPSGQDATIEAIAGHLTKASIDPDGTLRYEALLADTPAGAIAATLLSPGADGRQHLASTSIRGYWIGDVRSDAQGNETADDLEIDGVDLTDSPGVPAATAAMVRSAVAGESAGRRYVCESLDSAHVSEAGAARIAEALRSGRFNELGPADRRQVESEAWAQMYGGNLVGRRFKSFEQRPRPSLTETAARVEELMARDNLSPAELEEMRSAAYELFAARAGWRR
ncbi:MAG: hypothetical protein ACRDYC_04585 [Acidimicrobiales bacterium]